MLTLVVVSSWLTLVDATESGPAKPFEDFLYSLPPPHGPGQVSAFGGPNQSDSGDVWSIDWDGGAKANWVKDQQVGDKTFQSRARAVLQLALQLFCQTISQC